MQLTSSPKQTIKVGIIGAGWIGSCYVHAFKQQYQHALKTELTAVATSTIESAKQAAEKYGFKKYTAHWTDICTDENIDLVCIATPVKLHLQQAQLALEHGKHVLLEKPIGLNLQQVAELKQLAIRHPNCLINIGYNYVHNPIIYYAKELIDSKQLGELFHFKIWHCEDFLACQNASFKPWHIDVQEGASCLRDVGSHPLAMLQYLLGDIQRVCAHRKQQYSTRQDQLVTCKDDYVAALLELDHQLYHQLFGTLDVSWISTGRGMHAGFEIYGSQGSICFNQERLNELIYFRHDSTNPQLKGGMVIRAGSSHPHFREVCPGDEHGIGFMDLKSLEIKNVLDALIDAKQPICDLQLGLKVEQQIETIMQSCQTKQWQRVNYALNQ